MPEKTNIVLFMLSCSTWKTRFL